VADLIRGEDTDRVRVVLTGGDPPASPGDREGLSLSRWSIGPLLREHERPAGWWWDLSGDEPCWQPLGSPADLGRTYGVCLRSAVAAYDAEVGLRLGVAGSQESPPRREPPRPGWTALRAEAWLAHARAVAAEASRRLAREAWPLEGCAGREGEAAPSTVALGFQRRYGLSAEALGRAVHLCALLHDLGKLGEGWQRWAEAAQRSRDPGYLHAAALAHTDFDPSKPEDRERERALPFRRPPHAPASAHYARPFLVEGLAAVAGDGRALVASACLAAILAHHGGWWPDGFEHRVPVLWRDWRRAVRDALGAPSPDVDVETLRRHRMEVFLNVTTGPDEIAESWPLVAYLTRTLRLSDQRATAEAGCRE
jgi:CRISPR-associated endonuclease Cas3-HD